MLSCYDAYDWPDRVRKIWLPIAVILHLCARPLAVLAWEPFLRWYCRNNWEFVLRKLKERKNEHFHAPCFIISIF